jgi:hypothetical protein
MREPTALVRLEDAPTMGSQRGVAARWRRTRPTRPNLADVRLAALPPRRRSLPLGRVAGLLLAGLAAFAAWRLSTDEDSFAERLSQGCEQVEPCRQLEAEAAQRVQSCWLGCGRELGEHRMARSLRYRAEERTAVREHYRQRDDAERVEQQSERDHKLAEWQRAQAARRTDAEREQRQQLELERLRQDRIDRRIQEERLRRVAYLALLAPEARAARLERCHANETEQLGCAALVLDLIEAAANRTEKLELAAREEKLLRGPLPAAPGAASQAHGSASKLAPATPNS